MELLPGAAEEIANEVRRRGAAIPAAHGERSLHVDMTNWLRVVGERLVVKVAAEPGSLDRSTKIWDLLSGHAIAPVLYGWLDEDGWVSATVSEFIPDSTDGWTWAVDDVLEWLSGGDPPQWPAEVGALIARMHLRLSDGASGVPGALESRARNALAAAADLKNPWVDARADQLNEIISELPNDPVGPVFPIHGDLHVGQILRFSGGYRVLDFDGDPTLTRAERDQSDTAARDVAHLLVSIDMVASVAQRRLGRRSIDVLRWADSAQRALIAAYNARARALLDERLLPGLQVEQLLRELIYADGFLPEWRYAAEGALAHRFPITEEQPWTPPDSLTI